MKHAMRATACIVQDKLLAVRGEVTAALDALKEGLERRQSVASAKALLELMQDTAHVMSKVRMPSLLKCSSNTLLALPELRELI